MTDRHRVLRTILSRPPNRNSRIATVFYTLFLFAACALYWSNTFNAASWMVASPKSVFVDGEVWRLFTTLLAHSDMGHLLANSLMYVILGYLLHGYFGPRVFPGLALILAIPMTALTLLTYSPETRLLGASGLVHLMGGLWLSLYFFISRNIRISQRLLRALGVMLVIFFPTSYYETKISYRAHFIGLIIGLIGGTIYFVIRRRYLRSFEIIEIEPQPDPLDSGQLNEYADDNADGKVEADDFKAESGHMLTDSQHRGSSSRGLERVEKKRKDQSST